MTTNTEIPTRDDADHLTPAERAAVLSDAARGDNALAASLLAIVGLRAIGGGR